MTTADLLNKGYFPKELPPSFFTELFANNYISINTAYTSGRDAARTVFMNTATGSTPADVQENKLRLKQIFSNRIKYSDCGHFSIPKPGLARNIIKIPNPLHQGELANILVQNYSDIESIFESSDISVTKPIVETDTLQGKRAVTHQTYGQFKELCITKSYKYSVELRTDISKFYPSIYTHVVPWATFGKEPYKRNRALASNDTAKVTNIYGDHIDERLQWSQGQQTMGIPVGPDTSFIVAEIIACHLDALLRKRLEKKKIDFVGYRYYDDYAFYFNTELDAQICLTELKGVLHEFELKINDDKTRIERTQNVLETEWAQEIKSFYFRPFEKDQKEDLWNFFSLAFRYARQYPRDSVLKLAINKFNFVRIEKQNWLFFQSLICRLGLTDSSTLAKIAKLMISYKSIVDKSMLKDFCIQLILRNYESGHDYEVTWSIWLLNEFNIQPKKEIFEKVISSNCNCAVIIAIDLLRRNRRLTAFDYSDLIPKMETSGLNTKNWLLIYEIIYKSWIPALNRNIITDHFYFSILNSHNVYFYDSNRKLEPLRIERSNFEKIDIKLKQLQNYVAKNRIANQDVKDQIANIAAELNVSNISDREVLMEKLTQAEFSMKNLVEKLINIQSGLSSFEKRRPYFVVERKLEELGLLTSNEISSELQQNENLLFDPKYDE